MGNYWEDNQMVGEVRETWVQYGKSENGKKNE